MVLKQAGGRKFDIRLVFAVAARCPMGSPAVVACRPMFRGKPFPTTFWLTCPHAVAVCDTLEAGGGVRELECHLHGRNESWIRYGLEHALLRLELLSEATRLFLSARRKTMWESLRSGGIGGIKAAGEVRVKCLHLQTASWLALGYHPGESWLEKRVRLPCPKGKGFPCREGAGAKS